MRIEKGERDRQRETERQRQRETERDRERETDRERYRERQRDHTRTRTRRQRHAQTRSSTLGSSTLNSDSSHAHSPLSPLIYPLSSHLGVVNLEQVAEEVVARELDRLFGHDSDDICRQAPVGWFV